MTDVLYLDGAEATAAIGVVLFTILRPGDVIALNGDLGVGKVTLARRLLHPLWKISSC